MVARAARARRRMVRCMGFSNGGMSRAGRPNCPALRESTYRAVTVRLDTVVVLDVALFASTVVATVRHLGEAPAPYPPRVGARCLTLRPVGCFVGRAAPPLCAT